MRRAAALAAGAVAALLALPAASAGAADYYVAQGGSNANPCTQAQPCASPSGAAAKNFVVDGDIINIGPGTYGPLITSKNLTFAGAGRALPGATDPAVHTIIAGATLAALELRNGGAVRNLFARGGPGNDNLPAREAIRLAPNAAGGALAYDVQGVVAQGGAKGSNGQPGIIVSDGATGRAVSATVGGDSYVTTPILGTALRTEGPATSLALAASTVVGPQNGTGLLVTGGARATATASNLLAALGQATAVSVSGPSQLGMSRTTVSARRYGVFASNFSAGTATVTIDASLLDIAKEGAGAVGGAVFLSAGNAAGENAALNVTNSTLVAAGPDVPGGVRVQTAAGGNAQAAIANTVIQSTDTDGSPADADVVVDGGPGGTAAVNARASAFNDRLERDGGTATAPGADGNVTGDPGFSDPSHSNYIPTATSPLVDRGDPALAPPGTLDLSGQLRPVDGNGDCAILPDIGAYEASGAGGECEPVLTIANRPVRLTRAGNARVLAGCPAGAPAPCTGSLALTSAGRLRLFRRSRPAIIAFGTLPVVLAPGESRLFSFPVTRARRRMVRRYRRIQFTAQGTLTDPARGTGTSRIRNFLHPAPRRLAVRTRALVMKDSGGVEATVSCPAWEIEACGSRVTLRSRAPVRLRPGARRRVVTLASRVHTVKAGSLKRLAIRLDPGQRALVRRLGRLRAFFVITARDRAGNRARDVVGATITRLH